MFCHSLGYFLAARSLKGSMLGEVDAYSSLRDSAEKAPQLLELSKNEMIAIQCTYKTDKYISISPLKIISLIHKFHSGLQCLEHQASSLQDVLLILFGGLSGSLPSMWAGRLIHHVIQAPVGSIDKH